MSDLGASLSGDDDDGNDDDDANDDANDDVVSANVVDLVVVVGAAAVVDVSVSEVAVVVDSRMGNRRLVRSLVSGKLEIQRTSFVLMHAQLKSD